MLKLKSLVEDFWKWTGLAEDQWYVTDISVLTMDPLYYPNFDKLRRLCISKINTPMDHIETNLFLLCMGLDNEEELILDKCKSIGNAIFLEQIVSFGVSYPQGEPRWQIAELLSVLLPRGKRYLQSLLEDSNPYVRKRARNVIDDSCKE